jgi:type III secretory pathway component EscU
MSDTLWYATIVAVCIAVFVVICVLNIRMQRARVREEAHMTPEQLAIKRKEDRAFMGVFRRW